MYGSSIYTINLKCELHLLEQFMGFFKWIISWASLGSSKLGVHTSAPQWQGIFSSSIGNL